MDGIHLLGEWYGCPADTPHMIDAEVLRAACLDAVTAAGLTSVGDRFHQFEPQGVTGAVILAESHLAIHTWPEMGSVTLDVYVCNFTTDNTGKAQALFRALEAHLKPARSYVQTIRRGDVHDRDLEERDQASESVGAARREAPVVETAAEAADG